MKYEIKEFNERFFIGVEYAGGIKPGSNPQIGQLWDEFLNEDLKLIIDIPNHDKFVGLECYPPDFGETQTFDYFALLQTNELVKRDGFTSKKLPKGKYILFSIEFDQIRDEIQRVYKYVKENNIKIHMGFDYEDYIKGQDYRKPGARLNFALMLEE